MAVENYAGTTVDGGLKTAACLCTGQGGNYKVKCTDYSQLSSWPGNEQALALFPTFVCRHCLSIMTHDSPGHCYAVSGVMLTPALITTARDYSREETWGSR